MDLAVSEERGFSPSVLALVGGIQLRGTERIFIALGFFMCRGRNKLALPLSAMIVCL